MTNDTELAGTFTNLKTYGLTDEHASDLLASLAFLEAQGFQAGKDTWTHPASDTLANTNQLRDEAMIFIASIAVFGTSLSKISHSDSDGSRFLRFTVSYLTLMKAILQSAFAADGCAQNHLYADGLILTRTLVTKQNLLVLFALNPNVYDDWLRNPKELRYRDGIIRAELDKHGLEFSAQVYEEYSELVHGHIPALEETGYFEQGLINNIPALQNKIYVQLKFILAPICFVAHSVIKFESTQRTIPEFAKLDALLTTMRERLAGNRLEHLQNVIVEERNWEKAGKNKQQVGASFNYDNLYPQIEKFYRSKQAKKLGAPYDIY